jgi:tetratricopeptide (TPR) repeat protein
LARLQEAAKSYLKAIELNPRDAKSNMNLGLVYAALGQADKGLEYCRKAVELDPNSADAQTNLGVVMQAMGLLPESERHYRVALELDSSRVETAINLAGNLLAQKRYEEAISVYQNIIKSKNTSLVRQRYGVALLQSGKSNEAIVELQLAIGMDPKNSAAYASLGDAWIAQYRAGAMIDESKRKKAIESWKKSLELYPKQPAASALIKEYTDPKLYP